MDELSYAETEPAGPSRPGGSKSRTSKASATYTDMITSAIVDLNDRTGSSTPAITQWIVKKYPKLKVKNTTVGGKIRPLVASGYLERHKSSFKLSAATKDTLRKVKAARTSKKKDGPGGGGRKDRGLDRLSRVRKHLGLLPLISDHTLFEENTQSIAEHEVAPAARDDLTAAAPPKKKRRTGGAKKPAGGAGRVPKAGDPAAGAAASGGGGGGMMRGSARAKSAYNFYQDSVKATIRREQPGIGMAELRKEMMARWSALSVEERAPYEQQGAVAREMFNAMQAETKQGGLELGGGGGGGEGGGEGGSSGGGGFGGGAARTSPPLGGATSAPVSVSVYQAPSSLAGGGGGSAAVESSGTDSPDDPFAAFRAGGAAHGRQSAGVQSMAVQQGAGAAGLGGYGGAGHGAEQGSLETLSTWGGLSGGANGQGPPTGTGGGTGRDGGGPTW